MVMTKRGIFHNLKESEYATSNGEVALFFSSRFYLEKYLEEYKEHRIRFRKRIERAIILKDMNVDFLADIHLYRDIEKRGFRPFLFKQVAKIVEDDGIVTESGEIDWQNILKFALVRMTEKNTKDWYEMQNQKLEGLKNSMV